MKATDLWDESDFENGISDADKWSVIRLYRSGLLAKTDWTQLGDAPLTAAQKDAWTAYRQALRDLPQDFINPNDVTFPEMP